MIHVAVIGTGSISCVHIEGLLKFPGRCRITALVNTHPEKAEAVMEKYHLHDAAVFDSCGSLLESDTQVDLVHICTPPSTHRAIAVACMEKQKHVLVEKPMAVSLKECDEMLAAQARTHTVLACVAQNRFTNEMFRLKQMADSGLAGRIRCIRVDSLWWRGHSYYDLWWRGTWEKEGGGPTLNHAVHHMDLLNWIQGELPVEVSAMLANVMHDNSEVEDVSFAALRYADGSVAQVTSSVVHHGEPRGIELQCENAMIAAPWRTAAETSMENGFPKPGGNAALADKLQQAYESMQDLKYEGMTAEIDDVLTAIETGVQPLVTGVDGRRTLELITAIYKAGFEKRTAALPILETDEYYTGYKNKAERT